VPGRGGGEGATRGGSTAGGPPTAVGTGPPPGSRAVQAQPGEEELVAILAAVETAWPRPAKIVAEDGEAANPWRFSGRWWARPVTARRARPWVDREF
jgi:hypothetical protein